MTLYRVEYAGLTIGSPWDVYAGPFDAEKCAINVCKQRQKVHPEYQYRVVRIVTKKDVVWESEIPETANNDLKRLAAREAQQ